MEALDAEKTSSTPGSRSRMRTPRRNRATLSERIARQGEVTWQLARLETEWLEIAEALDRLDSDA